MRAASTTSLGIDWSPARSVYVVKGSETNTATTIATTNADVAFLVKPKSGLSRMPTSARNWLMMP
ncbi:hypothetical protein D3C74_386360 [compost metagenome]